LAGIVCPAQPGEHALGFLVAHARDLTEGQALGRAAEEEMLCHVYGSA
jgi:hypothetical protein